MKLIIGIWFLPMILSVPQKDYEDCWMMNNKTIMNKYSVLVNFSPEFHSEKDICSVQISNPWNTDMQNGFGVFLTREIDCSSSVTVECLPGGTFLQQTTPSTIQYTCQTHVYQVEMPCSLIGLTYKRNNSIQDPKSIDVQIVALAKEPCSERNELFQCPNDYSHSCINRNLRCNKRSECPSGDDESGCYDPSPVGIPIIVVVLAVLAFLILICLLSTVLICCCCRAAFNAIVRRLCPSKTKTLEKGEMVVATGEDHGLIIGLNTPSVLNNKPQQNTEPTTLVIDSTKPIYPRLQ